MLNLDVFLTCLPVSVAFGWFYLLVTVFPLTFGPIYHFSTGTIGLCFLACGIGNISGALSAGFTSDKYYNMKIKRNNGVIVKEFRLQPILFGLPFLVAGSIMYGWFIHARLFWIAPLIALVLSKYLKGIFSKCYLCCFFFLNLFKPILVLCLPSQLQIHISSIVTLQNRLQVTINIYLMFKYAYSYISIIQLSLQIILQETSWV